MPLPQWADYRSDGSWASRFRAQRFAFFESLMATLPGSVRLLDVGGTPEFWTRAIRGRCLPWRVTVLNLAGPRTANPSVVVMRGDACRLPFPDHAFDVVFSNSVIEHVADHDAMAREVQRVGRRYFVQTPNRYFPIEPHFLLPWGQFWPRAAVVALLRRANLGTITKRPRRADAEAVVHEIHLLTERDLRGLFPAARIYRESFGGLTKSLVAYQGWHQRIP